MASEFKMDCICVRFCEVTFTINFLKKFEKVVDKCLQGEYNSILSSPKSERFSEAQRAGSKPFVALDALVGTENFLKKFEKSA